MEEKQFQGASLKKSDLILDILMGSDLYFELPLEERYRLLKHIRQVYDKAGSGNTH